MGTLTLSNPNNFFTGGVTLNAAVSNAPLGTLVVGSPTALGLGGRLLTAGFFQVGGNFAIANNVNLNGGVVVFSGANPINFTGTNNQLSTGTTIIQANTATTFTARWAPTALHSRVVR